MKDTNGSIASYWYLGLETKLSNTCDMRDGATANEENEPSHIYHEFMPTFIITH